MDTSMIDSRSAAEAFVKGLDTHQRDWMAEALREAESENWEANIIEAVRQCVAGMDGQRPVLAFTFGTDEWDNGWFLTEWATVHYADGTTGEIEVEGVDEDFTELYGKQNSRFEVGVDVRTWTLHSAENGNVLYLIRAAGPEGRTKAA